MLVLQALYNLSDDAMEYQLRDRLSYMRFIGLGLEDAVPDAKTLWLYREALAKAGAVEGLFTQFDSHLKAKGYLAMGGQIIDATIVLAPRQRNSRDDNALIKSGKTPADWEAHPAKNRQKDKDARWTKKHGRTHFGYKNHISIDQRRYAVSSASVHDSQKLHDLLDPDNTASSVWADSAYRSNESEAKLAERGMTSHIHQRGSRGKPLVDDRQDTELAANMCAWLDEVICPDMPRILGPQPDARSVIQPQSSSLGLLLRHLQALTPPDTLNPFAVHHPSRSAQQCRNPAIAIATILARQCYDVLGELIFVICPARHLALRRPMLASHPADPPFGYCQLASHMIDAAPSPRRAQKFPRAASCRINLSSVRSEIARRSRRFSFSRAFIRRAWSAFRPPYSLRQR